MPGMLPVTNKHAFELAVKGAVQEGFMKVYQSVIELFTGRQVTYPD
jgi:Asp-tRNA(Asn)/Glu-tRNA(Gln) amidotransferase B subunit